VPDVENKTGRGVISGDDEFRGQPEVGDVGERQRFQRHPGSDLARLHCQLMQLGRPVGEVGQWWDDAVDNLVGYVERSAISSDRRGWRPTLTRNRAWCCVPRAQARLNTEEM
jgi:hypothetical protein